MVEPSRDAPDSVRRIAQEGKLCVMFYGPAANKVTLAFPHLLTQKESARALCTPLCYAMKAKYPMDGRGSVVRELLGLVLAQRCRDRQETTVFRPATAHLVHGPSDQSATVNIVHYSCLKIFRAMSRRRRRIWPPLCWAMILASYL